MKTRPKVILLTYQWISKYGGVTYKHHFCFALWLALSYRLYVQMGRDGT